MTIEYTRKDCKYSMQFSSLELEGYNNKTIDVLLLSKIKEKYLHKCSTQGYISEIDKIVSKQLPVITNKDLSADVTFHMIIRVLIANYNVNDKITCKIDTIDTNIGAYISIEKPFVIFLLATDSTKTIKIGETVSLRVVAKKIDQEEIHLICELYDN